MTSWQRLTDHTRRHHGAIDLETATALGVPARSLATWHEAGRLLRPAPQVYVVGGSPETWRQRVQVAALSTDGWASHRTAAALWDIRGFDQRQVEVLVPHGLWRTRAKWIVHESRRFSGVDIADVDGIPCTAVPRTVLDLPAVTTPFAVGQALDDVCRRWPGMLDAIVARFLELACRGRRGTGLLRAMLNERLGRGSFAQSGFETVTTRLVRSVGLPDPVLQHHVSDGSFSAYLDLAWPPILWAVECDSLAWHTGKQAHEWDRRRRRHLKRLGWDLVEVTYDDVTKRRRTTGDQLLELYTARATLFLPALRA